MMHKIFIGIAIFFFHFFYITVSMAADNSTQPYIISMITWRGETEAERGFIEGIQKFTRPVILKKYYANQSIETLSNIIRQLKSNPVDLIYVFGTTATRQVLKKIKTTPVVFNIVNRPVQSGIIQSWNSSKNNVTGASNQVPVKHQLEALKKVINYKKLGIIYNPKEHNSLIQRNIAKQLEDTLHYTLIDFPLIDLKNISSVLKHIQKEVDAIFLPADSMVNSQGAVIAEIINSSKIPSLTSAESMVESHGILMGLVPDFYQLGQIAAQKANQISNGINPSDIPSSRLQYFNILVNIKTAKQIEVQIPFSLLVMADKIVR